MKPRVAILLAAVTMPIQTWAGAIHSTSVADSLDLGIYAIGIADGTHTMTLTYDGTMCNSLLDQGTGWSGNFFSRSTLDSHLLQTTQDMLPYGRADAKMSNEVYGLTQADVEAGYQIDDYTLTELTVDESGLKAALFTKGDSQVAVYAGTSPGSWANWKANFTQAFGFRSEQYEAGKEYARSLGSNVHFTGHSMGRDCIGSSNYHRWKCYGF